MSQDKVITEKTEKEVGPMVCVLDEGLSSKKPPVSKCAKPVSCKKTK